jgi:hypothetical protein
METESWPVRKADFDFFASPEARTLLAEEGMALADYGALQTVWAHAASYNAYSCLLDARCK